MKTCQLQVSNYHKLQVLPLSSSVNKAQVSMFPTKAVSTYFSQDGLTLPLQKSLVLSQLNCQG